MLVILLLSATAAHAFWIWTPETKRWINPKYSSKENAQLQLAEVEKYYNLKQYKIALREAKKLVSYFPKAIEAADGQFYVGACSEILGHYYQAFKAYQLAIDKYPFSQRIMEMIKRQYEIGELYLEGKVKETFGNAVSGEQPTVEIFTQVVENAPYGEFAAASQYKLGLALVKAKLLYEAKEAFGKVLDSYPESEWVESAKYQIAVVTAQLSGGIDYDQDSTMSARKQLEDFVKGYPGAQLSKDAQGQIASLRLEEAQANFQTGLFYEKQKAWDSARIYYQAAIDGNPKSIWAKKARQNLERIKRRK